MVGGGEVLLILDGSRITNARLAASRNNHIYGVRVFIFDCDIRSSPV